MAPVHTETTRRCREHLQRPSFVLLLFQPVFEQRQQPPISVVSIAVPSETQESDDCRPKRCPCKVLRPEFGSLVRPEQKCAPITEHENRDTDVNKRGAPCRGRMALIARSCA